MSTESVKVDEAGEQTLFDSLARLVPEHLQAAYYRLLAHTRNLSPDDEMLRILEAMGVLALLTCETPSLIAQERQHFDELMQSTLEQTETTRERMLEYVHTLESRLADLPEELKVGLDPQGIAKLLGESLRQHFLKSGLPDTAQSLKMTAAELINTQKQFSEVFHRVTHPDTGIAAKVTAANDRVLHSVERRAREIDFLLKRLDMHVVRVWLPTAATAAFVVGLWVGIEVEHFRESKLAAVVSKIQAVQPVLQPQASSGIENPSKRRWPDQK